MNLLQKCKTPSKQESVILDQFLIELSEANAEESQASELDAKVCIKSLFDCALHKRLRM